MTRELHRPASWLLMLTLLVTSGVFTQNAEAQNTHVEFHIDVTVKAFDPDAIEVARGDSVRLIFTSADVEHSVTPSVFGLGEIVILPGGKTIVEFTPQESGTFTLGCTTLCSYRHFLFMRPRLTILILP